MGLKELDLNRFGLGREMGRVRVIYKYAVNPKYLSFIATFSLFLPILLPLSLCSSFLLRWRKWVAGGGRARWPAVLDGGAAAGVVKTTLFLNFFGSLYSTSSSNPISLLKSLKKWKLCPRSGI